MRKMRNGVVRLLAVDLGASGGKCFVGTFSGGGFRLDEIHRFAHEGVSFFIRDARGRLTERTYWDDTFLYRNIVEGLHAYRRNVSERLDGIGIDTWGADGCLMTGDGDILGKIYCYRDHRLDRMISVLKARLDPRRVYQITGIHFQPFNLSNQLYWFVLNRPDYLKKGVRFLPIPTVFYFYLGGVGSVDSTWASITQLMDARSKKWSGELLQVLSIPMSVLPRIVKPGKVVGRLHKPLAELVGFQEQPPLISVGSHDTASAFAAAPVSDVSEALIISSGTWSLVGKLVPSPITSDDAMRFNLSNEGGIGNVRLLKNCMGTWLVQELRRVWRVADGREMEWGEITRLAERAPAFSCHIDPDDPGFYNPPNMEEAMRKFCEKTGQNPPADRGSMLRTVYESLALKYRMVNEQIMRVSGTKTSAVHIVGGGSKNELLNQFAADALGLPVLAGPEEATAVGNLMVQAVGAGVLDSISDALPLVKAAFPIREYRPGNIQAWEKAYERFRNVAR